MIIEVTLPNRYGEFALTSEHLTPGLLYEELVRFEELKHYIPEIIITHMDPELENEIEDEVKAIAEKLKAHVTFAREGLQITV